MPKSIAILTHENSGEIRGTRYYLAHLVDVWEQMGITIHVSAGCHYTPADMAILHVDTSVVGEEYLELAARYPVAINGRVKNILKSSFSDHILQKDATYQGRVIVKTDANYGGINEYLIGLKSNSSMNPEMGFERPWRKREILRSKDYPVFDSIKDVPQGVWKNKKLIVEKFLAERLDNGDYRIRGYLFFGQQELGMWYTSPNPVIKGGTSSDRGVLDSIPECLREVRREIGFDYGRFDYTEMDGRVVLFDINKTPALSSKALAVITEQKKNELAGAIVDEYRRHQSNSFL